MKNIVAMVLAAFITIVFSCGTLAQEQQQLSPEAVVDILEQALLNDMAGVGDGDQEELLEKYILMPADGRERIDIMLPYQMMFFITTLFGAERTVVAAEVPDQITVQTTIQPIEYVFKLDNGVWKLDIEATWERLPEKMRTTIKDMMQSGQQKARCASCLSNLKQIALAALMYAQDHDETFPDAEQWMEQLIPYIGENDAIFHCPAAEGMQYGYAMNDEVSGISLGEVSMPSQTVIFFETNTDERNAHGGVGDIANPSHHEDDLNNFAFCDGHCMVMRLGTTPIFEVEGGGTAGVQKNDEPMPRELGPVIQLTDTTFTEEVLEQAGWVIVDFGSEQCAPCRRLQPVFGQLAELYEGRVKFASIDVIRNVSWANKLGVGPLPTLILYTNGQQVDRLEGFGGADELKAWIQHHMGEK